MGTHLREITRDNFRECVRLGVAEEQKTFVATNVYSIAQSKIEPTLTPLAIYHDDTLVGFTLFGLMPEDGRYWIERLMVDQRYQGRGYGRAAMREIIQRLKTDPGCTSIHISYVPENEAAAKLYASLGFRTTGEVLSGETVARLDW